MSYQRTDGRFVYAEKFSVSAVVTASGNSPAVDVGSANVLRGISVTAASVGGTTPTLVIQPQTSPDGTNWVSLGGVYATLTANGTATHPVLGPVERYVRLNYTVTGTTPTFTLTVTGDLV
jgi:hypothetical protein